LRKHRFYIFVIAALAVVGFVFHGSATTAHTANPSPARLGIGDLTGSDAASSSSEAALNGYSVALASLTVPLQAAQQQQAAQAQQTAQQQQAAQAQQAAHLQAAQQQQQAAQAQQAAQQQAAQQAAQQQQAAQAQQAQAQQAAQPVPAPAASSTSDDFARLRQCESGGNYSDDTGNGYYGAYQFSESTWQSLGYPGIPSDASPAQQDQAAQQLQAQDGWSPWPSCSAQLGLG
jgi:cell division protein FtsN